MAEIFAFTPYGHLLTLENLSTKEFKTTFFCLDDVYYDIVELNGFQIERHLRLTEQLFPEEAKGWFKQHSTSRSYALRYEGKTWKEIAGLCKLPVIQVDKELYILVYELGPVTMVQLAAYQAAAHGAVGPEMHDIIFADYFPIVARDTIGLKALDIAYRRMFIFGTLPDKPRKIAITSQEPEQRPDGRRPTGVYMYGPNKGKPYYGPEGQ